MQRAKQVQNNTPGVGLAWTTPLTRNVLLEIGIAFAVQDSYLAVS